MLPLVLILVVVAIIQVILLRTEVGKGFMTTVVGHELVGSLRQQLTPGEFVSLN